MTDFAARAVRRGLRAAVCLLAGLLLVTLVKAPAGAQEDPENHSTDKKRKPKRRSYTSGPAITPANPAVAVGNSIALTSSTPVTWSLNGVGTLSNQTSNSVTYTAPASVIPQNQMLGCPVLPNDTVFNTPIDNLPLDPNSNAMIAAQSTSTLSLQPSWGISYADNSTPTRTFLSYYDSVTHPNFVFPNPGPNEKRESGDYVGIFTFGANRPDHHVMTVRRTDCTFYETYDDYTNGYLRTCNDGTTPNCNVQSATNYSSTTYQFIPLAWGTDAGGFLLAPLVWHADEIKNGSINHAVRFTEGLAGILFNSIRWPASNTAGGCSVCPNAMPMGARLRLKAGFNISNFSPAAQVMLTALKKYGMILVDTGSNNAIQPATDVWDDPTVSAAVMQISSAGIGISNFEVVDESSLQFGATSYAVCPFNTTCMGAKNTYEQPLSQAMISATTSSGAVTSLPIALAAVSIGLGVPPVVPIQAGSYNFQIPFWVNNATNQNVTWTLQSGVGSVTSAGVYTPPATTTNSGTTAAAVLKGVSAADPNVSVTLYATILPAGASPTGSIRIDTGAPANTTDANGSVWLADTGAEGTSNVIPGDYPSWSTTNPQRVVYQSAAVGYGNDLRYVMVVPNGNYRVHYLLGTAYNGCQMPCGYYAGYSGQDIHTWNPQILETQGTVQLHYFDYGAPNYSFATPADAYVPAKVTNNLLEIAIYALAPDSGPSLAPAVSNKYNILNGIEILPDISKPHWTVDTQQQTKIAPGQTLKPFYVVDWYTGVNDPTWSIVSGPAGASLSGSTLSLAAGNGFNGQPVVVQASDGTYSTTVAILTAGGTLTPLGVLVQPAAPPPVNHFSYKRAITIPHANVPAAQTNFPVEVSISDPTFENAVNGGHVQQANGYDIVLTSDSAGANRLSWEVEKYDPVGGSWIAHVKIPSLSNTADTVIYAFYGNPAITTDQSGSPAGVWDSNFTGIYHMTKITTSTVTDSTGNGNSAVANSNISATSGGEIGSAALFPGNNSGFHFELPAAVLNASQGTISFWMNTNQATNSSQNWASGAQIDSSNEFHFAHWASSLNDTIFGWVNQGNDYRVDLSATLLPLPLNTWEHVAYTWNLAAKKQVVYLNGVAVSTATSSFTPYTPVANFWVGSEASNPSYCFSGLMDEMRFSNINRSAAWIATEFANQSAPGTFLTIGAEAGN